MPPSRVHLLEVEPDFGAFLSDEEKDAAAAVSVPVRRVPPGPIELDELLREAGAFTALVLDGMVLHRMEVGDRSALGLLGPGDLFTLPGPSRTELLHCSNHCASDTRLALLDDHVLVAARHFPRLVSGLQIRLGEQQERLAAQMVICQMPRVEDRVLTLMWLLAEVWGRVTASGTSLPLALTHEVIGELVGAQRSTVTLALTHLAERGSMIHQNRGWLLLEKPLHKPNGRWPAKTPELVPAAGLDWREAREPVDHRHDHELLIETVTALRDNQRRSAKRVEEGLERAAQSRRHSAELRQQVREYRRARRAPS